MPTSRIAALLRSQRQRFATPALRSTPPRGNPVPVDNCLDDGSAGTLRSVLATAADGDTVDLSALTCSTITLAQGPLDISMFGSHPLADVTLKGPGRDALTIDGGGSSLVLLGGSFYSAGTLAVNDLTIANGRDENGAPGCILLISGVLALNRVAVTNCVGGTASPWISGGAVFAAELEMTDSSITNSSAYSSSEYGIAAGGGAFVSVNATLIRSTISGNSTRSSAESMPAMPYSDLMSGGGGLYSGGSLVLVDSTISGNTVEVTSEGQNANGGGVFAGGAAWINGSTFEANVADGDGGGISKAVWSAFSAPPLEGNQITVSNSTFSGNSASYGGGIATARPLWLSNSTVAFNSANGGGGGVMFRLYGISGSSGEFNAQSSIIASNTVDVGALLAADLSADAKLSMSGANNLIVAADAAIALPADTLASDPQLLPLADNGGPTRTHALVGESPAIDTGANPDALEFDQRGDGFVRVSGSAADIGAFELQQSNDVIFDDGFDGPAVR